SSRVAAPTHGAVQRFRWKRRHGRPPGRALGGTVRPRPSSPATIVSLQVRYGKSFWRRSSDSSTDFAFAYGPKYRAVRSPSVRVRRLRGKSSPSVTFTYG